MNEMTDEQKIILLFNAVLVCGLRIHCGGDFDPREFGTKKLLQQLGLIADYMVPEGIEKFKDADYNKGIDLYKRREILLKAFRKIFGEDKSDEEIVKLGKALGHDQS